MSRMQSVSETCEREMRMLACRTPKVSAYSATDSKEAMKGLAKPFVICNETPSIIEKMKKTAI